VSGVPGASFGCRWRVLPGARGPSTAAHDTKPTRQVPDRPTMNSLADRAVCRVLSAACSSARPLPSSARPRWRRRPLHCRLAPYPFGGLSARAIAVASPSIRRQRQSCTQRLPSWLNRSFGQDPARRGTSRRLKSSDLYETRPGRLSCCSTGLAPSAIPADRNPWTH
jgi:hypothetical protein